MKCPACQSAIMQLIGQIPFRDFDGSIFNYTGELLNCKNCGFSRLHSPLSDQMTSEYYVKHCLNFALAGVGAGGDSVEDFARYDYYFNILKKLELLQGNCADIGCSRGGFIKYLKRRNPDLQIIGVDIDKNSLAQLGVDLAREGSAFNLPFENNSIDLLCYFHVLEHVFNVDAILTEAVRVLKEGGHIFIEVPDATRYGNASTRVGAFYWLAQKEHVNHFSPYSMASYCQRNGLRLQAIFRSELPMINGHQYPSLILSVCKSASDLSISPFDTDTSHDTTIKDFYLQEKELLTQEINDFLQFINQYQQITFWGIGLEFFNLYAHCSSYLTGLDVSLLDSNPKKCGLYVDRRVVKSPPTTLNEVRGGLVCCSLMSGNAIVKAAKTIGWVEKDIYCLKR